MTAWLAVAVAAPAAQVALLSNGFNSASLPAGWTTNVLVNPGGGDSNVAIYGTAAAIHETAAPYEGSHFILFNSWYCASGAEARLQSPAFSSAGYSNLSVQFAWFQDARTGKDGDSLVVQWTTNGTAWTDLSASMLRRGSPTGWSLRVYALPSNAAGSSSLQVGFKFHSGYGNNCYLDDVRVVSTDAVADYPYSENFDSGFGAWATGPGGDFAWTRHTGETPSGAVANQTTGVSAAQSGSYYLYTESSDPNYPAKTAILEAPFDFSSLQEPRLWFYYHMCGASTGTNNVDISTNGGAAWINVWTKAGQQQDTEATAWAYQSVNLGPYAGAANVRVRFRGCTAGGGLGDMAIDSVAVSESVTIKAQSFDDADASPWSYTKNPDGQLEPSTNKKNSGATSMRLQGSLGGATNAYVEFANASLSGWTNVSLLVPFGATAADSGDDLWTMVSYDNGISWVGSTVGVQVADGLNDSWSLDFGFVNGARTPGNANPYILHIPGDKTQILARICFQDAEAPDNRNDYYYVDDVKLVGTPVAVDECSGLDSAICVSNSVPTNGSHITAGAAYTKTWVLSNAGHSAWASNALYSFAFGGGTNLAAAAAVTLTNNESVTPGQKRTFSAAFNAPTNGGRYAGFWSLRRNGTNLGDRVWLHVLVDTPDIYITNQQLSVSSATATISLGGTNHSTVTGTIRWTNALSGASGTFAAASPWTVSGIGVSAGDNLITVRGTNAAGVWGGDSITIARLSAPVVNITNSDATVSSNLTLMAVKGTNNAAVSGHLSWSNSLGGAGAAPASLSWTIPEVPIAVGTNVIVVRGTNAAGESAGDTLRITRPPSSSGGVTTNIVFQDDFEDGDLAGWAQGIDGHWTNSTSSPLNGSHSLKHALSSVAATSFVRAATSYSLSAGPTTWRFQIKNGAWDPSTANCFWSFLMASDPNLTGTTVNGYAVGVNYSGSTDLLTLWRVSNGTAGTAVVTSSLDWGNSTNAGIEVIRSVTGVWELRVDANGGFDNLLSAGSQTDTTYSNTAFFGFVFKCTSTRAGEFWADDVLISQVSEGTADNDFDGMPDWWEDLHFTNHAAALPGGNADNDEMSNWEEWVAGTDPTNPVSFFATEFDAPATGSVYRISWFSISNRTYSIYRSTNLLQGFAAISTNIAPTPPLNVNTQQFETSSPLFHRIGVRE